MPTQKLTQNSFTSGQYDRAVQGKEQSELVASGLAKAMNVVSSESGELRKRLGTRCLTELSGASVIVPYRHEEDDLLLLFGNKQLSVLSYNDDNSVSTYQEKKSQLLEKDWTSNIVDGYEVDSDTLLKSETYKAFRLPTNLPGNDKRLNGFEYGRGETLNTNTFWVNIKFPQPEVISKLSVVFSIGWYYTSIPAQPYHGYTNAILQYSDDGKTWTSVKTLILSEIGEQADYQVVYTKNADTGMQHIKYPEYRLAYDVVGMGNLEKHLYWRVKFIDKLNATGYGADSDEPKKLHIECYVQGEIADFEPKTTNITNLKNIKYSQSESILKIVDGETQPIDIRYDSGLKYSLWNPSKPTDIDIIKDYGFPSCVSYFQNRLWLGGFSANPTTVLASKFNDESDFTLNSPAQYDDGLKLKSNELKSKIVNMVGGRNVLYCMSQDGLSFIDGGSTGLLATNQNIEFHLKNPMPAGDATPIHKDGVLLYGSADGTKLYSVDYDLLVERFQVDDIAKYAKDVIKSKVTELQYVNNEAKLVYGLTENNQMFALLYVKGELQGFFPINIQNGFIYDISVIKKGRDYKLLMVVNRGGKWFLEEKLDKGTYISTDNPLMTKEDLKWATYDNLENNIALDCYKTYENAMPVNVTIIGETVESQTDLGMLLGKEVMFVQTNGVDFLIAKIDKIDDETGIIKITPITKRGNSTLFDKVLVSFDIIDTGFLEGTEIGVISQGRYIGDFFADEQGKIYLPFPVYKVIYGTTYESYGIIKVQKPYESMKSVQQINLSVIDTAHLQVGTGFNDLQELEKIKDDSHYDLTNITMNGSYRIVPSDTPEWDKYIILRSVKGLPFTVVGVETFVNYSNTGGN